MIIREASEADIPEIVNLLKISLGESLLPKSEKYWRWKHVENPFGPSPVLLAEVSGQLVGVRAFMRWIWEENGKVIKAVRAVDTATHPQYQGRGIFKKLTLKLVDVCKADGIDFVFNTPNSQSRPGYLKMGWELAGRLPVTFLVKRPFRILRNVLSRNSRQISQSINDLDYLHHPGLKDLLASVKIDSLHTNYSPEYLRWRYQDVPVVRYSSVGVAEKDRLNGLLVYRLKPSRFGVELRICDIFARNNQDYYQLFAKLNLINSDYITFSISNILAPWGSINLKIGPVVTIRNLNLPSMMSLAKFHKWSPSVGDLELF